MGVAERARDFADVFGAGEWGYLAGLWHDIGKYSRAFQEYLRSQAALDVHQAEATAKTDHSTAGAQWAVRTLGGLGHLVAFPISGHHSGLLDAIAASTGCLEARLRKSVEPWSIAAPSDILEAKNPPLPPTLQRALQERDAFSLAFFVRMLFSCLVDADFLDTGAFMAPERERTRPVWPEDSLGRMERGLHEHLRQFGEPTTDVDRRRSEVLTACLDTASQDPGFFSLTVPTGGGKTLSSLAFALAHAGAHGLCRVIYVAPFTSIIEQNADVFRDAIGDAFTEDGLDPVLEHHSSLDPEGETTATRLAAENWDAPLVVTTAVQFYESLFANRSSRCRKLHNLARSVIILDEAQCLPVDFLGPCLKALDELVGGYGASVVLCTATQPAVTRREDFPIGLDVSSAREIIPDPPALFHALKRVEVTREGVHTDEQLATRLGALDQVLCIVNTRRQARAVFELMRNEPGVFHLSANMCAEHRTGVLRKVKQALRREDPCRVVATQVVEAGVDIDFPVVFRAMAGLDSIAQAAGRCNRNGLRETGRTIIFESEYTRSEVFLSDTIGSARQVLALHPDPLSLGAVEHYFRLYYWEQSHRWDSRGIEARFKLDGGKPELPFLFDFASAARDFRIIEETGVSVIVPWGNQGKILCDALRAAWPAPHRGLLRKLQRYTVQMPRHLWRSLGHRAFELVHDRYPVLAFPDEHYSAELGLCPDASIDDKLII